MASLTDQIIRDVYRDIKAEYDYASNSEILDILSGEVGKASSGLVNPMKWLKNALIESGISNNNSEAHARIARIINENSDIIKMASRHPMSRDIVDAYAKEKSLIIHARLEWCSIDELNQSAVTMLNIAIESGSMPDVDNAILCLLIFSHDCREKLSSHLI